MEKESSLCPRCCPAYQRLINAGGWLKSPLLLGIRLFWGWQFFLAGKGKLGGLDTVTAYFQGLGIPFPKFNAIMAGSTEMFGGLLLLLGLGSRLVSLPLAFVMVVAYATAEREAVTGIFANPDGFVSAAPFQFLFAALLILAFGPGKFSLDALIGRWYSRKTGTDNSPCGG